MKKLLITCLLTTVLCGTSSAATILSEGFEGTFPPAGWTQNSVDQSTTYEHTGSYSAKLGAAGDYLITPPLTNTQTLTYWTYTTSADPDIIVETSTSVSGPWTAVSGSPFSGNTAQWNERIITLASSEILYAKIRKSGSGTLYVDDVSADDAPAGNSAPVLEAIGNQSVILSNELSFAVIASDVNGDDIILSATGLPPGASFNTVTNASAVTNTFSWTTAAPTGTWQTVFSADDGTTNDSETITITVTEAPVLPDSVTFDFRNDADLYGALDDETGPITYTNNGLVATFTTTNGTMNRTGSGFGINTAGTSADDTVGFDTNEWIDITFAVPVALTNVETASWGGTDTAIISINGTSNGVITAGGNTPFELIIPSGQTLRIAATNGTVGNGWSLESITVRTDTNAPPTPAISPVLISEIADPDGTGVGGFKARFVEIYNAGTNTVDLAADSWTLSRQNNGGTWSDFAMTGTIGPDETYVIASTTNFAAAYGFEPDQTNSVADGNGFDAYFLFVGGNHSSGLLVDIYGEIDTDGNNTEWDYEDARARRNNGVEEPNTTWTSSEWTLTPNSTTNMFTPGTHGVAPEFIPALNDQNVTLGDNVSLTVTVTNGVNTNDVITLSAIVLPGDADFPTVEGTGTVSSALSWTPTNSGTYKVTFLAEGSDDLDSASIYVYVTSAESPVISLAIPSGGPITLAWPTSAGSAFNVLTNSNLLDTNGWGNANLTPFLDGGSYKVTNSIGVETNLFYKLESQ